MADRYTPNSEKETKSLYKPKSFLKKLFIYYPSKIKHVFLNSHVGKALLLFFIIIIIAILIVYGYKINGDYPESTDNEIWHRFATLLLSLCMGLLSGIISIILGVESYKTFLEHKDLVKKAELVSRSKKFRRSLKKVLEHILKLFGSGPPTDTVEPAAVDVDVEPAAVDVDVDVDVDVKPLEHINDDEISENLEQTKYIIDPSDKENEINKLMILLFNNNTKSSDALLQAKQQIINRIETETKTENVKKLKTDLKELKDLLREHGLLQDEIKNNIK